MLQEILIKKELRDLLTVHFVEVKRWRTLQEILIKKELRVAREFRVSFSSGVTRMLQEILIKKELRVP